MAKLHTLLGGFFDKLERRLAFSHSLSASQLGLRKLKREEVSKGGGIHRINRLLAEPQDRSLKEIEREKLHSLLDDLGQKIIKMPMPEPKHKNNLLLTPLGIRSFMKAEIQAGGSLEKINQLLLKRNRHRAYKPDRKIEDLFSKQYPSSLERREKRNFVKEAIEQSKLEVLQWLEHEHDYNYRISDIFHAIANADDKVVNRIIEAAKEKGLVNSSGREIQNPYQGLHEASVDSYSADISGMADFALDLKRHDIARNLIDASAQIDLLEPSSVK